MQAKQRIDEIRRRLTDALHPTRLEVIDESHKHVGHIGAQDGRGHFKLAIRAEALAGMTSVGQHQKIYEILGELMHTDIHAITIDARSPEQNDVIRALQPEKDSL